MKLFKRKRSCSHEFQIVKRSNAIQYDHMGYPLRLCICECEKCGQYDQRWLDTYIDPTEDINNGELFLLKWEELEKTGSVDK